MRRRRVADSRYQESTGGVEVIVSESACEAVRVAISPGKRKAWISCTCKVYLPYISEEPMFGSALGSPSR